MFAKTFYWKLISMKMVRSHWPIQSIHTRPIPLAENNHTNLPIKIHFRTHKIRCYNGRVSWHGATIIDRTLQSIDIQSIRCMDDVIQVCPLLASFRTIYIFCALQHTAQEWFSYFMCSFCISRQLDWRKSQYFVIVLFVELKRNMLRAVCAEIFNIVIVVSPFPSSF